MLKGNPNQLCLCVRLRDREQLLSFMMKDHNTFRVFKFDRMDFFGLFFTAAKMSVTKLLLGKHFWQKRRIQVYFVSFY